MPTPASSPHRAVHFHPVSTGAPEVIGLPALTPTVKATIRFLIVDDDRTLRESCANLLQLDGYQGSVAGRGQEALELLRHRKFDIVLLDLYMSDVSGYELLRAALETSAVAKDAFGDQVHAHLVNMARQEWLAFGSVVTDWERRRCFEQL